MFRSSKHKIKDYSKSHIVYEIQCPICSKHYVSKNDWCFATRLNEHGGPLDHQMHLLTPL